MASYLGARLWRSGRCHVTLVGTWTEGLDAIRRAGVRVEDQDTRFTASPDVAPLHEAPQCDLALVLVKSHQTEAVASFVASSLRDPGSALTLQNGLGNAKVLSAALGGKRLVLGVTSAGATMVGPGCVRGFVAPTLLARDAHGAASGWRDLLAEAGLPCEVRDDLDSIVWRKLAINCAINPLSALTGLVNGALLLSPEARNILERTAREVGLVAAAKGVQGAASYAEAALEAARLTAENRSSMLQDLDRGAPTEIEVMNGAVVREADRLGIAVPMNRSLAEAVRAREASPRALPRETS